MSKSVIREKELRINVIAGGILQPVEALCQETSSMSIFNNDNTKGKLLYNGSKYTVQRKVKLKPGGKINGEFVRFDTSNSNQTRVVLRNSKGILSVAVSFPGVSLESIGFKEGKWYCIEREIVDEVYKVYKIKIPRDEEIGLGLDKG